MDDSLKPRVITLEDDREWKVAINTGSLACVTLGKIDDYFELIVSTYERPIALIYNSREKAEEVFSMIQAEQWRWV